ncbi:hypothetical protein PIROE2DRAFT_15959 [Piromyces sp. E2]|nr:hypothetical protein PIROE2DRAFT_15959 [Piromyces sp. E2]|eukprot:OUM58694.1 hypothetical protein PIROE2DRAFT_15959 [Piromyces sp. E2]
MNCKSIFHLALLLIIPFVVLCKKKEKDPIDENSDILLVIIDNNKSNEYASAVNTFKKYDIPYYILKVPKTGIDIQELEDKIYVPTSKGIKMPKYSVIIFPNGRVSFDNADYSQTSESNWQSALSYDQWEFFYDCSRNFGTRLVFLNEYPSNYTSTKVYKEYKGSEAENAYQQKQTIIAESYLSEADVINQSNLNTEGIYHFPAVIVDYNNGITAEPLLYFSEASEFPEKTIAAVSVENNGAHYAAFFMAFGEWSNDSTALNIIWLTWATAKDFKLISGKRITSEEAIKENGIGDYNKYEILFVIITTIITIIITRF